MIYSFLLFGGTILVFVYLLFIRTEHIRSKLISNLKGFHIVEEGTVTNKQSKYIGTNDPRPRLVMNSPGEEVILLTCSTHGQLKHTYLLCIVIDDSSNPSGLYGKGRCNRILKECRVKIDYFPKDEYMSFEENFELVKLSQFIEVCDGKVFMFFPVSSFWGTKNINEISKLICS